MPTTTRTNRIFSALTALPLCLGIAACQPSKKAAEQVKETDSSLVKPSPSLLAQLKIEAVGTAAISDTIRVAGRIDFDEQRLARIGASVTGRITDIHAQLGNTVKRGQVLAQIHSNELSAAQLVYLKARSQMVLHQNNVERAQSLFATDVISSAELLRRNSELDIASAETRAAYDQLRVLGLPEASITKLAKTGKIDSVTPVVTTQNGTVVERKLAIGQVVQPADSLFVVADLSQVWAVAQVPEQQISHVREGQAVSIEIPALNNEKLIGKLIFVGQTVSPETRTVLVRTELDNRNGQLKPAMLASMLIESAPEQRTVIPSSAVVREHDVDYVFVVSGEAEFKLTKVKLGPDQDNRRVVLDGLKPGMQIVSEGGFHLNNERNRAATEGH